MNNIRFIDKHTIQFFKPIWSAEEILLAQCLEMSHNDTLITADIRVTWKKSMGGFIRKVFPTICYTNKPYISQVFAKLKAMYEDSMNEFLKTYAKRLDYSRANKSLRKYQLEVIYRTTHSKSKLLALDMGTGKMENVDSQIITPFGSKRMGDIQVGDRVFGSDGKECNVTGVYPQGKQDLYKIYLSDGSFAECGLEHLWIVTSNIAAPKDKYRRVMSTKQIIESGLYKAGGHHAKWCIPYTQPVEFPSKPRGVLDPYLLGLLLGDGCFRKTISYSTNDTELVDEIQRLIPFDSINIKKSDCNEYGYLISPSRGGRNHLIDELRRLNIMECLSHEKFIPESYKLNDIPTRLAILQGLMDTDGSVSSTGNRITYTTVSPMLANDVRWLVLSLGGHCTISECIREDKRLCYQLSILFESGLVPFRLQRHIDKLKTKQRVKRRNIVKIEKLPPVEQQCISVDSYDHSYLTGDFIVTHNTISSATISRVLKINRTCIVGPSVVKWNWYEDMCHGWGFDETAWTILEPKNRKSMTALRERFVVINYEMIGKLFDQFKGREIDHFIVDEVHNAKNVTTQKFKNTHKLFKLYPKAKRTLLSGTPQTNRILDMYAYLKICDHPLGKISKKEFQERYAIMSGNKCIGAKNIEDFNLKISNFMIRLKSDDVLELPKLTISKAYFEMGSLQNEYNDVIKEMEAIRKEYDEMSEEDEKKQSFKFASKMRSSISSLSRITSMSKIPDVIKWVNDLTEQGEKVVIFSSWRGVLEEMEKKFNGNTVRIDGSVPPQKRQEMVNRFQNNEDCKVFLGQVKAAGVGINLTAARIVILMDVPVSPDLIEQPVKRCHRGGQERPVVAYFTFAKGTVDERLYSIVTEKAGDINAIIDVDTKKGVVRYENIPEQLFKELTDKR